MQQENYADELILDLRRKYNQTQPDAQIREQQGFQEVSLYDGLCTIMLPANLHNMKWEHRYVKYRSLAHPEVVMTDENADATFTFSFAGQASEGEEPKKRMDGLRVDMQRVWKQAVFYDTAW